MESGCAEADRAMRLSTEQTRQVDATCADTMRIRAGTVQYDACVDSLSQVITNRMDAALLAKNYNDCVQDGHKDGTADFALCVLDRKAQRADTINPDTGFFAEANREASEVRQASFVGSRFDERRRREETACAQLGLVPGRTTFGQCVADLDVSLWGAQNTNG
jgi:hypothetical protein